MNTTHAVIDAGAMVRVTGKSVSGDPDIDSGAADVGEELTVFDYEEADGDEAIGRAYYSLDNETTIGGYAWAYPEHVEVIKTAEELASRRPPSLEDVRNGVSSALMGMYDPLEVDETDHSGDDVISVYGRSSDGLRVGFRVRVDQIEEVD